MCPQLLLIPMKEHALPSLTTVAISVYISASCNMWRPGSSCKDLIGWMNLVLLENCACCLNPGPNPNPVPLLQVPVEQQEVQANLRLDSDGTSDVMRKSMLKRRTFENFERVKNRELNVVEGECF